MSIYTGFSLASPDGKVMCKLDKPESVAPVAGFVQKNASSLSAYCDGRLILRFTDRSTLTIPKPKEKLSWEAQFDGAFEGAPLINLQPAWGLDAPPWDWPFDYTPSRRMRPGIADVDIFLQLSPEDPVYDDVRRGVGDDASGLPAAMVALLIKLARDGCRKDFLDFAESVDVEDPEGFWQRIRRRLKLG